MSEEKNNISKKIESQDFGLDNQRKVEKLEENIEAQTNLVPEEIAPTKKKKFKAVRTYRDYAAEKLRSGGGSLTEMILAEREKEREEVRNSVKNKKNILIIALSLLVIAAGVGAILGAFYYVSLLDERRNRVETVIIAPDPLVFSDFKKEVYIPSPSRSSILREVGDAVDETSVPVGLIRQLVLSQDNERKTSKILMTSEHILTGLEVDIPPRFYRTVEDEFYLGVYSTTNNSPFLVFKVGSYSSAYADMLAWERFMGSDLADLFGKKGQDFARVNFGDIVLFNKDVRAVLDESGEAILGYSFLDQETLVIFENKLALKEVITRLQANKIRE